MKLFTSAIIASLIFISTSAAQKADDSVLMIIRQAGSTLQMDTITDLDRIATPRGTEPFPAGTTNSASILTSTGSGIWALGWGDSDFLGPGGGYRTFDLIPVTPLFTFSDQSNTIDLSSASNFSLPFAIRVIPPSNTASISYSYHTDDGDSSLDVLSNTSIDSLGLIRGCYFTRFETDPMNHSTGQRFTLDFKLEIGMDDVLFGDVNLDGIVNLVDVMPFVDLITTDTYQAEGDLNCDAVVDLLDIMLFVNEITGN